MKLKEVTLASILVSATIAQNYLLYSLPITLTYTFIYIIGNKINNFNIKNMSIIAFVIVKNIIYPAIVSTIIFDLLGLLIFINFVTIKPIWLRYVLIPIIIIFHILLLDFSTALLMGDIIKGSITNIMSGFITYIYTSLSIIFIIIIDGIDAITEYEA